LHMAQLMPLALTVSCFSKIQIGFTFLVPGDPGCPGQRAVKRVCVRARVSVSNQLQQWTNVCTNFSPKKWGGVGDATPLSKKSGGRRPCASPPHYTAVVWRSGRGSGRRCSSSATDLRRAGSQTSVDVAPPPAGCVGCAEVSAAGAAHSRASSSAGKSRRTRRPPTNCSRTVDSCRIIRLSFEFRLCVGRYDWKVLHALSLL